MLDSFGYCYEVARNGQEAIDKLSPDKYSLVLLDMQMPFMDGYETTKHIRRLPGNARVVRYLAQHHRELLSQFQQITEMKTLTNLPAKT